MTLIALLACQQSFLNNNKKGILLVCYTITFMLYLGVGGFFFLLIEGPQVENMQQDILDIKNKIMQKYPNVPGEALDDYMNELKSLGIRGLPDPKGTINKWTLADAVFFSVTLLTTIGYGHVSPRSILGKVICMLYTGFGIPVTLILLASYVERLMKLSECYKAALFRMLQKLLKPFYIRLIHVACIMIFILLVCFILPAIFFSHYEKGWGTLDGIYFCFISLTTVGLGDLVPALDPEMPFVDLYKYAATFYLIAGVTMMMFMMAMTADFQQNYNCCYESLPFTIQSEKIAINPNSMHSYGSLLTQNEKSENESKDKITQP